MPAPTPDLSAFREHWQDEGDAAFLYRALAAVEGEPARREVFRKLADVEDRHLSIWRDLLEQHGASPGPHRPTLRARLTVALGRRFGARTILPALLREEGREVRHYLSMHRGTPKGMAGSDESLLLARESAEHASELSRIAGGSSEPWHRAESGGFLRNVVYGFNDGLTANFGLVAGVLGATATQQHEAVVVAGVAGLVADALSMGSSGYLAAKSEQEVYDNEIAMERDEIALMPELEQEELALLYEAKGMSPDGAQALARDAMRDPERMLKEKVQLELGISGEATNPWREAWITGLATAIGALIPVFPFFVTSGRPAIVASFVLAMAAHFLVGAARSLFTGRGVIRSGIDMFVVGLGVAIAGYYAGEWISGYLG
ncbi:MAG: VIT1/CCC1 transporter family protein [Gemmatimonadetes bacterium]|nr:VIT1/CCC1 transporter family protein [Gemmatimonadota bacterium]